MKHFRKKIKKLDFASNGRSNSLVHSFKPSLRLLSVRRKAKRVVGKIWRLPKQARNEGGLDQTRLVVEMRYGWQWDIFSWDVFNINYCSFGCMARWEKRSLGDSKVLAWETKCSVVPVTEVGALRRVRFGSGWVDVRQRHTCLSSFLSSSTWSETLLCRGGWVCSTLPVITWASFLQGWKYQGAPSWPQVKSCPLVLLYRLKNANHVTPTFPMVRS